jgi:hypothetical protein
VTGSGGIGTNGNPATGGTGLNLFANPQAVFNDFGFVQLSSGIDGYGHPMYGLGFWNLDSSLGKRVVIKERKALNFTFDFYNTFNHPNFTGGAGSITGSGTGFGVISGTSTPANRQSSGRWIMFGARLEF